MFSLIFWSQARSCQCLDASYISQDNWCSFLNVCFSAPWLWLRKSTLSTFASHLILNSSINRATICLSKISRCLFRDYGKLFKDYDLNKCNHNTSEQKTSAVVYYYMDQAISGVKNSGARVFCLSQIEWINLLMKEFIDQPIKFL